jgi:excisionase family DNA binding protein
MSTILGRLPRLHTIAETAEALRVCTKTVRRLIARGELRSQRVGNRYRIAEPDIRAYLARATEGGALW